VATNVASLTIVQPSGVDLDVWNRMQQVSGHQGWGGNDWAIWGEQLAGEIRANFASSAYLPWVACRGKVGTFDGAAARLDKALSVNPPASLRDNILWCKAALLNQASDYALEVNRNIDECLSYAGAAESAYSVLQHLAIFEVMKGRATEGLTHIYTRKGAEDDLRMFAALNLPAPAKVIPRVECVTAAEGKSFSARFGYRNPNKAVKVLQIGDQNQVTPAPRDQGQPRSFKVGDQNAVFTAQSPGGQLIWHLDGAKAVASADFPVKCTVATLR
jgi:hypothetical protein